MQACARVRCTLATHTTTVLVGVFVFLVRFRSDEREHNQHISTESECVIRKRTGTPETDTEGQSH